MYNLIIKNGLIVDGTCTAPYIADIAVQDDNIVKIGKIEESAEKVIDAEGKIVTPGFIDIHCHSDAIVFSEYKNPKRLQQGFTTEVIGNCGISAAPVNPQYKELLEKYCAPYYANIPLPYDWVSYSDYLNSIQKCGPILNTAAMVGHGTLRVAVAGFDARKLTEKEMQDIKSLLGECLDEGAFGMSTGLIYPPGIFADDEEIFELTKVVKEKNGVYTSHMRSESDDLIKAVQETIDVALKTGVNTEISHHKAAGKYNFGKTKTTLKMINDAVAQGANINCDVYPYDAASTQFSAVLPPWAMEGGVDSLVERLSDEETRKDIIKDIKSETPDFESFYRLSGWDKILINECTIEKFVGKTVEQIAQEHNRDPFEMALDIIKESKNNVMMIVFFMSPEDVSMVIQNDISIICTDGFPSLGKYHPRYTSAFVRVLEKYVKQEYLLSLPQAIHKMTLKPAQKLGITNRGVLQEGTKADILVIDFDALHDNSDYDNHDKIADGIQYVVINGIIAVDDGNYNPVCAGKVLRSTDK